MYVINVTSHEVMRRYRILVCPQVAFHFRFHEQNGMLNLDNKINYSVKTFSISPSSYVGNKCKRRDAMRKYQTLNHKYQNDYDFQLCNFLSRFYIFNIQITSHLYSLYIQYCLVFSEARSVMIYTHIFANAVNKSKQGLSLSSSNENISHVLRLLK